MIQDDAPTGVPVAAMEAMMQIRFEQIHKWGHTPEGDMLLPVRHFANELQQMAIAIVEDLQFRRDLTQVRRHAARLGAMAMAMFDRVEAEISKQAEAKDC